MQHLSDYGQVKSNSGVVEIDASQRKKLKPFDEADISNQSHLTSSDTVNKTAPVGPCRVTPDIFAQVALYLMAPDVLTLARTNKSIRKLFMSRSSAHVWRAAIANLGAMPRCPATLSEPAYVALVFTTNCSKCGQNILDNDQSLEANLLVRLCGLCRVSSLIHCNDIQPNVIRSLVRTSRDAMYSLRAEVEEVTSHMSTLSTSGSETVLAVWKLDNREAIMRQRKFAEELTVFVSAYQLMYARRRQGTQAQYKPAITKNPERPQTPQEIVRHAEIKRRLMALGWTHEDMTFTGKSQKAWMEIRQMNTPVTYRHWKKIRPRLVALLESNSKNRPETGPSNAAHTQSSGSGGLDRHSEIKRRLRLLGWTSKDMEFPADKRGAWLGIMNMNTLVTDKHWKKICPRLVTLLEVNRRERPVREKAGRQEARRVRLETLWKLKKTEMESLNKSSSQPSSLAEAVSEISRLVPIPEFSDALEWPVLKQLVGSDTSNTDMEACFAQQKSEIEAAASNWCASIKSTLADILREGFSKSGYSIGEEVLGVMDQDVEPNPFENLSGEMQLLLRADSVFSSRGEALYDRYLRSLRNYIGHYGERDKLKPLDTSLLGFCPLASSIVRAILRSLGRPENMSFLELRLRNEYYICGRCGDDQPKSWEEIVEYYTKREKTWSFLKAPSPWFARHGIACHHIHDTKADNDEPLVKVLTPEERIALEAKRDDRKSDWLLLECCLRCPGPSRAPCDTMIRPHMLDHLRDVHEIEEPLLADPNVRLLKVHSNLFSVLRPGGRCDYYGFSSDDERLRLTKSEWGSNDGDSEGEYDIDSESGSEGGSS